MVALPKPGPAKRVATYADIESAPPNMTAEIISGSLVLSPRPSDPHAAVFTAAIGDLFPHFGKRSGEGEPGGWVLRGEPELHLDGIVPDVFVPDIAGWKRERFPERFTGHKLTVSPDWVCEILSKSTRSRDQIVKAPLYARAGIQWLWLVDPTARVVEVFRNERGLWAFVSEHEGNLVTRMQPFDAVEIDLGEWWLPDSSATPAPESPTAD